MFYYQFTDLDDTKGFPDQSIKYQTDGGKVEWCSAGKPFPRFQANVPNVISCILHRICFVVPGPLAAVAASTHDDNIDGRSLML